MALRAQNNNMTGWHHRVLVPGFIQPGDEMKLVQRINSEWCLSRVQHYMYVERENIDVMKELLELEGLGEETRGIFVSQDPSHFPRVSSFRTSSMRIISDDYSAPSRSERNLS